MFVCVAGRSGATGLYLGGQLAGAERRDVFSLFNSYFQDPLTVTNAGRVPKKQFLILIFSTTKQWYKIFVPLLEFVPLVFFRAIVFPGDQVSRWVFSRVPKYHETLT